MTDETKPTPGPWHVDKDGWVVNEAEDFAICLIDGSRQLDEFDPIDRANATLIIAAPDMLEALKGLLSLLGNVDHSKGGGENTARLYGGMLESIREIASEVVAKAEGSSK